MKNKRGFRLQHKSVLALILVITLAATLTGFANAGSPVLEEMKQILKNYYVSSLPDEVFDEDNVNDIIKEINKTDPYTKYYTSTKYTEFVNTFSYSPAMVGAFINMTPEGAQVESIVKNSAESLAGLQVGDIIILADNHLMINIKQELANKYILGEPGKTIRLRVKRGSKFLNVDIFRTEQKNSTVEGQMLDKHIGYIKISSFGEDTEYLFESKLNQLKKLGADSYILDLRYNNGGFLNVALDIAGYFIGVSPALITKSRISGEKMYRAIFHGQLINRPVICLINGHSASAAEILAASIKDYKKATFIGSTTYGKGSIQWPAKLSNNDVIKLTIEKFYSPKGNQIDKVGIKPDFALSDEIDSLRVAQLLLSTNNFLRSTSGYVKINFSGKTVIIKQDRATSPLFWKTYRQLLELSYKNGSVMRGNGQGWTAVKKEETKDFSKMFFPDFKKTVRLENVDLDSQFTLNFGGNIAKENLTDSNIELIDTSNGKRVSCSFKLTGKKSLVVVPKEDLIFGKTYYLVVHPIILESVDAAVKNSNGNISGSGNGLINEIITISNKYTSSTEKPVVKN